MSAAKCSALKWKDDVETLCRGNNSGFRKKPMQNFRDLKVWQNSFALTLSLYRATRGARRSDFPGLVPQLLRAAASIPANIAEGCGHVRSREFARYLQHALASAFELENHLLLAANLGVLNRTTAADLDAQVNGVKRMLASLMRRVKARDSERRERS